MNLSAVEIKRQQHTIQIKRNISEYVANCTDTLRMHKLHYRTIKRTDRTIIIAVFGYVHLL